MQKEFADVREFEKWYTQKQTQMKVDELSSLFNSLRVMSIHHKAVPIVARTATRETNRGMLFQNRWYIEECQHEDLLSLCEHHTAKLQDLVAECESKFLPLLKTLPKLPSGLLNMQDVEIIVVDKSTSASPDIKLPAVKSTQAKRVKVKITLPSRRKD